MKIAFDISPLKSGHFLQHRVRGTGFYVRHLLHALEEYFPQHTYHQFSKGEKIPPDINVIHCTYFEPFFLTVPLSNLSKTVVTVHDLIPFVFPDEFPAGIKGSAKWLLQKFFLKRIRAIITDSESSKRDIVKYAGINKEKVHVAYLAAAPDYRILKNKSEIKEKLSKKYKLPEKFALYVGDVTWNKNLPRLVQAVTSLNIPLVMVGKEMHKDTAGNSNPWNKDKVALMKLSKNNPNIIRLGFIPTEDLVGMYNIATVFTMPSLYEGFGLPILEAMGSGCPVVTARSGSLSEVAGDASVFVNPTKVEDIARGIKEVYEDSSLRENLIQKGLIQHTLFNWKKTAQETLKVYETLNT